jgi:hypothetical protein
VSNYVSEFLDRVILPTAMHVWSALTLAMTDAEFARFKARLVYEQSGPPRETDRR